MPVVEFEGSVSDIDRFAESILCGTGKWEQPCDQERKVTWDAGWHAGYASTIALRSGLLLTTSVARGEEPFAMTIEHAASQLEFCISRGSGIRGQSDDGTPVNLGGPGQLQVSQVKQRTRFHCEAPGGSIDETVHLAIQPEQLRELMGTAELPAAIADVLSDKGPFASRDETMTPQMFALLDDILSCKARGPTRQLYLESKSLELIALAVDHFAEVSLPSATQLTPVEVERLHRARSLLLSGLDTPPTLAALARHAGLNERKLKMGFKALFGTPVYSYLRAQRMERARELLRRGRHSVTEVARVVGYSNPSKFSAAFRRQFGINPGRLLEVQPAE